jgi:DNA-binding MarR family transcriptional regulator
VKTSPGELQTFETATRDLVGLALRSVDHLEVSLPQFRLLLVLHELGPVSSTQCAEALGVVASSVTRLADRLHASGHLVRGSDPRHRSIVTLQLTDEGRQVVQKVVARRQRELRQVLDQLEPEERSACAAALEALHRALVDTVPDAGDHRSPLPL